MPRSGIMLCSPLRKERVERWILEDGYVFVQPKLNGERARGTSVGTINDSALWSSESNKIVSVPHINKQLNELLYEVCKPFEGIHFDGELYIHRTSKQAIRSLVGRTRTLHPDHEKVEYHIFDLVAPLLPQDERTRILSEVMSGVDLPNIKFVISQIARSLEDVETILVESMCRGYEGVVIRKSNGKWEPKRSTTIQKWKPRAADSYLIIGTTEEVSIEGVPKDSLGSFTCISDGQTFNVGSGPVLTRAGRNQLWRDRTSLVGKHLLVLYPELTDRKVPSQGVAFAIV